MRIAHVCVELTTTALVKMIVWEPEQQVRGEVMTGLHFTGCHIPACSLLSSRVHRVKDDKLTAHHTGYQASNDILLERGVLSLLVFKVPWAPSVRKCP
ncbi:hypothetical protein IRJ41_010338 [Triplophysa rosa]|uniref:Uncharacterized protein n=1 Tax=Triplophysa rosa TaxID=992332 RepID=A0A9W7WW99_TRIRA|nr:hypothetical protein IRJ41_010338 [Triplophysa rosa]